MFGLMPFHQGNKPATRNSIDDVFDIFNEPFFQSGWDGFGSSLRTDIKDNGDHYELIADLPGMNKEDIDITFQNGYLTISANKNTDNDNNNGSYIRRERRQMSFQRSFSLEGVNEDAITADFNNGVLTISLPKVPEVQRPVKRITIR